MSSPQNILVCVTQQITCERLILKAAELRNELKGELFVIHVAKNEWNFLDNIKEGEALEYLFKISKSVGANLSVLKSDDIVQTIVNFAKENKITHIVMGESPNDHKENNFYNELKRLLSNVEILVIPQAGI
ncbi:MAG TPA: universal stress protein UspA [Hungateiclostridium thermocellum]|uniref:UspA domain-containing protein n=1 Tax=Acetivibrio thermocellus (strain ATCC 27405 / DSM 1237 / JCM 9322 / NBRC 103400 / NCIMB 10682 / NRRL B-4536 / VPI 7372) TaxID=203119 RepID=A3DK05_ACET2|nr:UspA domain-containing protein [Acetivibrio thermocellus ATCC 27405]THJ76712.1 universal stress protein UspA [Acetivibrio thermocellus]HBW28294.1 universal stress protein UspA [Acetivibrio thermocellus]